jgi:hypothetical protein
MRHFDKMRVTIPRRQLDKAEPVAMRVQPHRFGIDGDILAKIDSVRQVIMVKMYGHLAVCPQIVGARPDAWIIGLHYMISAAKCQLNLSCHPPGKAVSPTGGIGAVPVAGAKIGGQAASTD